MLFDREPLATVTVPVVESPFLNAVITRSKNKEMLQQQLLSHQSPPTNTPKTDSSIISSNDAAASPYSSYNYFDIERIKEGQVNDPNIQQKINEIRDKVITSYTFDDGLLYKLMPMHVSNKRKIKVIYLPISMVDSLLKAYHDIPLAGHFGVKRTYFKLKNKFCRIKKPGKLCPIATPDGPFQLIGIDFCGPFKRTHCENRYVLCITDYFARWVDAITLPNCSVQTTVQTIFNDYICRYGVSKSILSDQGIHFNNQLMDSMPKLIGYNHIFSTVYHPQSSRMVERCNATFVPQLAKLHDHENNDWDEYLSPPRLPIDKPEFTYLFHKPNDYYAQLEKEFKHYSQTRPYDHYSTTIEI
ncbi:unnamed protein product [Rotaria magnacalcarata]|uniref:Integrase catalytic domain-containing protein n=1 Tax=Rotaria magnacalcarata TaxID=392030 RepID=A0A816MR25_9BILA|nr:unnamed protein product [Rotaria magnacalcarata]